MATQATASTRLRRTRPRLSTQIQAGLVLVCLVALVAFPLVFSNPATTTIAFFTLAFAAAGTAWNIFSGYTGYIALGHAAFFGSGAYALAIMCKAWNVPGGWLPFALVPVAGLVAALLSLPVGAIALRTRRHTFVVITIAIFFIFQLLAYNLRAITAGSAGLELPLPTWGADVYNLPFYYVMLLILIVAVVTSMFVRNSKYGLELLAIRDDEDRALSLGVHTTITKLSAFVISAFFVGMVGAMWAYFLESIYPPFAFDANFDVAIALMGFLGGLGTVAGPLLGALIIIPAQQLFAVYFGQNGLYLLFLGSVFLAVVLLLPQGIVPAVAGRVRSRTARRTSTAVAPAPIESPTAQPSVNAKG